MNDVIRRKEHHAENEASCHSVGACPCGRPRRMSSMKSLIAPPQSAEPEWMDHETVSEADLEQSLAGLRWVNRWLGGSRVVLHHLAQLVRKTGLQEFSVLDIATGSADIPAAIVKWSRSRGLKAVIQAIDKNPLIIESAQKFARPFPEISCRTADYFGEDLSSARYDFVIASLFLHHLEPPDAVPFLRRLGALCRRGAIVNDLVRGWLPYYSFGALSTLLGMHPMVRHDGAVSVLRSYRPKEAADLCRQAGWKNFILKRHFPYRMALVLEKDMQIESSP